ncbi:trehalose biosynthesis protein [soil metagenome]
MGETGRTLVGRVEANALLRALAVWMPGQRWFAGKGTAPVLRLIGSFELASAPTADVTGGAASTADVCILTALVLDEGGQQSKLYQVPLTMRSVRMPDPSPSPVLVSPAAPAVPGAPGAPDPTGEPAASEATHVDPAHVFVYDGTHDLAYAAALLTLITTDSVTGPVGGATATGRSQTPGHPLVATASKVLSGEQSNTSIIMTVTDSSGESARPVICKVFRVLHHGNNPDVVLQSVLAKAGSTKVAASIGSVVGQWDDSRMPDGRTSGHLAFAQEFLPRVEDAWRVALDAVGQGRSFAVEARALGEATAEVHETLAAELPTLAPSPELIAGVLASMRRRHAGAVREVPALAEHSEAIERLFEEAARSAWPRLQRIHGDYHLGQVLAVPGGGWVIVDFEGEPLRPMVERNQPDLVLRDIAGMLRSFDYVAGSFAQTHPGRDATDWAHEARDAFLDGYAARSGLELRADRALLDAFEIDKALYEAIYEVRNRPTWVTIPTTAVARLAHRQR